MWLADTAVRRPVLATMVIAALIVFGFVSLGIIGVDLMPDIEIPVVTITTVLPGADPETIVVVVTAVIVVAVNSLDGIDSLRSISSESVSIVVIEFELEKQLDVVVQDVRDKVAGVREHLPDQIEEPLVEKLDFGAIPIITLAVFGREDPEDPDEEIRRITEYTRRNIKERLQTIGGVGSVQMIGGQEREIRVWLDADRLRGYGIPVTQVIGVLAAENVDIPGGRIETHADEATVKTHGDLETVEEFNDLVIAYADGAPVRLRDIGNAEDGMEDLRSISFLNGRRAVALQCRKVAGANTVALADAVLAELEEIRELLPPDIEVAVALDNSTFIKESIEDVQGNLLLGGTLAVLTILFFLRNFRTSIIAAIAIPTAVISTFTFINFLGFTVNTLTMLALTISVGMLIDDAVVVIENTYRHIEQEKKSRRKAAMEATAEIGLAIVSTSLSILAVFVPVAFMTGIMGRFFYEFGLTVAFAVVISTFVSLTLTPMLCSRFLRVRGEGERRNFIARAITALLRAIDRGYRAMLAAALRLRVITVLVAIAVFVASLYMASFIPSAFLPPMDEGAFTVAIEAPLGSSIHETMRYVSQVEGRLRGMEGIELIFVAAGGGRQGMVNEAQMNVKLVPLEERAFTQMEFMDAARERLADIGGVQLAIGELRQDVGGGGGFGDYQVQYSIRGTDLEQVSDFADAILARLAEVPGFVDLDTSFELGKPEIGVRINRDRAADLGVSMAGIATTIRALVGGENVTTFQSGGYEYDVRVRLQADDRDDPDDIERLMVVSRTGQPIELGNLAEVSRESGPVQINRQNRMREIRVMANLTADFTLGQAVEEIDGAAVEIGIPPGVRAGHFGMAEMMQESFESINFTLLLAIIIIYMVLASLFESFIHPFTIMLSLPLAIVGAMGLLLIAGKTVNLFSMIGVIMLMGLVTKNAILLIDYTNTLRRRGLGRTEAILTAGPRRLRPIMMTTFSTILGSLPVAIGIGSGAGFRSPMGVAVIGGLLTSMLLTLLVVPVVYTLLDDLRSLRLPTWLRFRRRETEEQPATSGGGSKE